MTPSPQRHERPRPRALHQGRERRIVAKKTTYTIIQPPFDLKFREMTKKDLAAYRE